MHPDRQVRFASILNTWLPAARASSLSTATLLSCTIDEVPIVFFRDASGRARALVDRCPHRSVKLSCGRRTAQGTIECAFHGWQFDGSGQCVRLPLNPQARLDVVAASSVPCHELGGLLWIYTAVDSGDLSPPPLPEQVPKTLTAADFCGSLFERNWKTHWSRAIQTALDVAHIPYVHPLTIGLAFGRALGRGGSPSLHYQFVEQPGDAFRLEWSVGNKPGEPGNDSGWLAFHPPCGLTLGIPTGSSNRQALLHMWSVPTACGQSKVIVLSRRNFGRYNPIPWLFDLLTPIILREDQRIMDTAWPSPVPPPGHEVSMPADAPTVAFARYYHRTFGNIGGKTDPAPKKSWR